MNFPINYDGMCRTCLRKGENLADIFIIGKSNITLSSAIMECAPVHILPGDGMPTQICSECIDKLQIAHRFREMCLQADRTLRQYLSAIAAPINPPLPMHHNIKAQQINTRPYDMPVKVELITPNEPETDPNQVTLSQYGNIPHQLISQQQNQQQLNNKPIKRQSPITDSSMLFPPTSVDSSMKLLSNEPETKLETLKNVSFNQLQSVNNHRSTTNEKRFSCDVCEKSFHVNNALIKHYRIHSGERPYKCNICGKDFNCSSTLSVHIRFHNNDRRFKCTLCDKSYVVKSHLTVHMRSHTGEHPYSCHVCDKRFRISKSLTRHLKNNTCDRVVNEFTLQKYTVTLTEQTTM